MAPFSSLPIEIVTRICELTLEPTDDQTPQTAGGQTLETTEGETPQTTDGEAPETTDSEASFAADNQNEPPPDDAHPPNSATQTLAALRLVNRTCFQASLDTWLRHVPFNLSLRTAYVGYGLDLAERRKIRILRLAEDCPRSGHSRRQWEGRLALPEHAFSHGNREIRGRMSKALTHPEVPNNHRFMLILTTALQAFPNVEILYLELPPILPYETINDFFATHNRNASPDFPQINIRSLRIRTPEQVLPPGRLKAMWCLPLLTSLTIEGVVWGASDRFVSIPARTTALRHLKVRLDGDTSVVVGWLLGARAIETVDIVCQGQHSFLGFTSTANQWGNHVTHLSLRHVRKYFYLPVPRPGLCWARFLPNCTSFTVPGCLLDPRYELAPQLPPRVSTFASQCNGFNWIEPIGMLREHPHLQSITLGLAHPLRDPWVALLLSYDEERIKLDVHEQEPIGVEPDSD